MLYAAFIVNLQAKLKIVRQTNVMALRICFRLEHVDVGKLGHICEKRDSARLRQADA